MARGFEPFFQDALRLYAMLQDDTGNVRAILPQSVRMARGFEPFSQEALHLYDMLQDDTENVRGSLSINRGRMRF